MFSMIVACATLIYPQPGKQVLQHNISSLFYQTHNYSPTTSKKFKYVEGCSDGRFRSKEPHKSYVGDGSVQEIQDCSSNSIPTFFVASFSSIGSEISEEQYCM